MSVLRPQAVTICRATILHRRHCCLETPGTFLRVSSGGSDCSAGRIRHDTGIRRGRFKSGLCSTSDGAPLSVTADDDAQEHEEGAEREEGAVTANKRETPSNGWKSFLSSYSGQRDELLEKLKRYGLAGVLAYGLCNTLYYLGSFLFVWFFITPSSGGLGFSQAARRFVRVLAMVWAGSQVTKLLRAGGALAFAPVVDAGLVWFTSRFNIGSRRKAFGIVVAGCVTLALTVFLVITSLWA